MLTDRLLSMYRRKASMEKNGPKNGQGEIHGSIQRDINELEERLLPILEWSRYKTSFDTHFFHMRVVQRKCR